MMMDTYTASCSSSVSDDSDDDVQVIVLDNGSGRIKAGFVGNKTVSAVFRTIVGTIQNSGDCDHEPYNQKYVGDHALEKQNHKLDITYPMDRGIVKNWDDMQEIWKYLFAKDLRIDPEKYPILLTETIFNPKENRERMAEIMFEIFKFPALYIGAPPVLSLVNSGRLTGLVCDVGDSAIQVVPILKGQPLLNTARRVNIGGRDVTSYLHKLLFQSKSPDDGRGSSEMAHIVKEGCCQVLPNTKIDDNDCPTIDFLLPNNEIVHIGKERFQAPEVLLKPSMLDLTEKGASELIYESIMACDAQVQPELFQNIILAGGSTMFKGFSERIHSDVSTFAPAGTRVKVIAPPERNKCAWMGGSILAGLSSFQNKWITRKQYLENGPSIVHELCKFGESLSQINESQ